MTTPTPMARAVEAMRGYCPHDAGCPHYHQAAARGLIVDGVHDDDLLCNWCAPRVLRAALPALLEAVVGEVDAGDLGRVWAMGSGYWHHTRDMPKPLQGPATGAAMGMCFPDKMRAMLLLALTDAVGRLR